MPICNKYIPSATVLIGTDIFRGTFSIKYKCPHCINENITSVIINWSGKVTNGILPIGQNIEPGRITVKMIYQNIEYAATIYGTFMMIYKLDDHSVSFQRHYNEIPSPNEIFNKLKIYLTFL